MKINKKISELVEKHPYLEKPIFIVGSQRSGSTLMLSLLDNHPQLLVLPFEFGYYYLYADYTKKARNKSPKVSQLNSHFHEHINYFGGKYTPPIGKEFSLASVDVDCLRRNLEEYNDEILSRKQYLQLFMYAYHQSTSPQYRPNAFMVKINWPSSEIFEDFPDAKIVCMVRNPVSAYTAIKKYYFKTYESFPPAAYFPRTANRKYKWGLLEAAVTPIFYYHNWFRKYRSHSGIIEIKLEDLRKKPKLMMKKAADFLNISFVQNLLEASKLGQSYGSNLTSGVDSKGKIVQLDYNEPERYIYDLTPFEKWWVLRLFNIVILESGYGKELSILELSKTQKFWEFWRPMKNEFPVFISDQIRKSFSFWFIIRFIFRWTRSLISYMLNSLFFLTHAENKVT